MRPRRDYQTNRLVPGRLQLPPASQLLLDETTMAPGTLAPAGIANLQVRDWGLRV
jgi:Mini-chromosome maintenance replisome factor